MEREYHERNCCYSFILSLPFHSFKKSRIVKRGREGKDISEGNESVISHTHILRKASGENGSVAMKRKISY